MFLFNSLSPQDKHYDNKCVCKWRHPMGKLMWYKWGWLDQYISRVNVLFKVSSCVERKSLNALLLSVTTESRNKTQEICAFDWHRTKNLLLKRMYKFHTIIARILLPLGVLPFSPKPPHIFTYEKGKACITQVSFIFCCLFLLPLLLTFTSILVYIYALFSQKNKAMWVRVRFFLLVFKGTIIGLCAGAVPCKHNSCGWLCVLSVASIVG